MHDYSHHCLLQEQLELLVRDNEQLKSEVRELLNSSALASSSLDHGTKENDFLSRQHNTQLPFLPNDPQHDVTLFFIKTSKSNFTFGELITRFHINIYIYFH